MQAKEFLNQPFILNNKINDKKVKIECYRMMATSVSSPGFEEHYSSNRNTNAPFVRYLEKISELEEEVKADCEKLEEIKAEVASAILKVNEPSEQLLLHYRYVMFMSMSDIAVKMNYSLRWAKKLHRRALDSFEKRTPPGHP